MESTRRMAWAMAAATVLTGAAARGEELLVIVRDVPADGLVVAPIALPAPLRDGGAGMRIEARATAAGGGEVDVCVLPPLTPGGDGLIVLDMPGAPAGGERRLTVSMTPAEARRVPAAVARSGAADVRHEAGHGGMPVQVRFRESGKAVDVRPWGDRVHHGERGGYRLCQDPNARLAVLHESATATALRARAAYRNAAGRRPDSRPRAVYDWVYLRRRPVAFVRAAVLQDRPAAWSELHFLELKWRGNPLGRWAGGEPQQAGELKADSKGRHFDRWCICHDGAVGLGVLGAGTLILHDGRGGYGTYVHAWGGRAWQGWRGRRERFAGWLWLGEADDPPEAARAAWQRRRADATVLATRAALHERIVAARGGAGGDRARLIRAVLAAKAEAAGDLARAARCLDAEAAPYDALAHAGDLVVPLAVCRADTRALAVLDAGTGTDLAAAAAEPLFRAELRELDTGKDVELTPRTGWGAAEARGNLAVRWSDPNVPGLEGLGVRMTAGPDANAGRLDWRVEVTGCPAGWAVRRLTVAPVAAGAFADGVDVLYPKGCGVVGRDPWGQRLRYRGTYPSGWTTMQVLAVHAGDGGTGLYLAAHDANAWTKDVIAEADATARRVVLGFDVPLPDMHRHRERAHLPFPVSWQLCRGDWFDACRIYRRWAAAEASWWPRQGPGGREDSPKWIRELCMWGLIGGGPDHAAKLAREFVRVMDQPCGLHWYSWHRIPFDNDYPHYFPAREGFAEAVRTIQQESAHPACVMPYINGRLWDTRDRDANDWRFGTLARPAAAKDESGRPYVESYGSKESDGTPVKLAAMCPSTKLWQDRVGGIVLRLMGECGTRAVYIDQVAAAKPRLCFDAAHGHRLGGGGWWVRSYGELLGRLRREMPPGRALTTECNAEPYIPWFDAYLTWHWQYQGQVPAFPAVYGGTVQMFGRAYRGGPDAARALRMKAGQQLCYGEQIGWIGADVAKREGDAAFLRTLGKLRRRLLEHFVAGRMERPPRPRGDVPAVTADWRWHGVWPVTTPAVLTAAWRRRDTGELALLAVNVSGEPVTCRLALDRREYGLPAGELKATALGGAPPSPAAELTIPAETAWAWVIAR